MEIRIKGYPIENAALSMMPSATSVEIEIDSAVSAEDVKEGVRSLISVLKSSSELEKLFLMSMYLVCTQ